jgi:hypothetical protein
MEMPLKMPCPVCVDEGRYAESFSWSHHSGSCPAGGGKLMLNDYAKLRCTGCQKTWKLLDSLWGCPGHSSGSHSYEFKKASYYATVESLRFACQKYRNHPGQAWFDRLMRNLGE